MNTKAWAKHVATSPLLVGFDPVTIITILSILLPMIVKWCNLHKNPEKIRAKAAKMLAAGDVKPKPKQRKMMRKQGVTISMDQDNLWLAILADAASSAESDIVKAVNSVDDWAVIEEA
jgi:hypothetical protein